MVTGAAGFLGSHLACSLSKDGRLVRGGVRKLAQAASWNTPGVSPIVANLLDRNSLMTAVQGVDMVYHCASVIPGKGNEEEIWRVNIEGTRNLLDACVKAGVPRLLFISSDSIYGDQHSASTDEQTPARPKFFSEGNYPRSKWEGEKMVMDYHYQGLITVSIIRPCLMYGPGWSTGTDFLCRLAKRRLQRYVAGGQARLSLGYVENIIDGIKLAGTLPIAAGEAYNLSDKHPISMQDIVTTICRIKRRHHLAIPLPTPLWLHTCKLIHPLIKHIAPRIAEHTNPEFIQFMSRDHVISIQKAHKQLGYAPNFSFEQGCQHLFKWQEKPFSIL